jgi:branched-chain amino acid transport system permease protein
MMGINTHVVTAVSWGLAGALGALAATINASSGTVVSGYFMTNYQVYAFLAGILGGFSTFHGPVIAALMIPLANNLVQYFVNMIGKPELTGWSMVIVYAVALVIIFFKPQGIFGKKIARKV